MLDEYIFVMSMCENMLLSTQFQFILLSTNKVHTNAQTHKKKTHTHMPHEYLILSPREDACAAKDVTGILVISAIRETDCAASDLVCMCVGVRACA